MSKDFANDQDFNWNHENLTKDADSRDSYHFSDQGGIEP